LDIGAIEGDFILALIKHFPDMTRKQAIDILNTNIPDAKVKLYYSMLANFISKAKNRGLEFIKFL
jgi:GTP cyclohydrolase II